MASNIKIVGEYLADSMGEGSNNKCPFYYKGHTAWHYGEHYVIAQRYGNNLLVNNTYWSSSTSGLSSKIYPLAIAEGYRVFRYRVAQEDCKRVPSVFDVLNTLEENIRESVEYVLKIAKSESGITTQIRTLSDLIIDPRGYLDSRLPDNLDRLFSDTQDTDIDLWGYLKEKQSVYPTMAALMTDHITADNILAKYVGLAPADVTRKGASVRFLESLGQDGFMTAALNIAHLDGGYAVRVASKILAHNS